METDDEEDSEEEDDENDDGDDDMEAVEGEPILTMQQLMQYLQVDSYEFLNFPRSDMVRPWWEELYVTGSTLNKSPQKSATYLARRGLA
ncbi:hypothetical protein MaudCBS49596_006484 [Microsporum audouinii]